MNHYVIMLMRYPAKGYVFCAVIWADTKQQAITDFKNKNEKDILPMDQFVVWDCKGCEECDGKRGA